ncbi:MAG: hypothetical protein LBL36_05220 [Clostridiales Family XIII bacterium]|jgi:hypothetical protein|nr:hypothetical protein [Clostridiales Family XIII bacterium]
MKKSYHIAMVEDKRFGVGTVLKAGAVAAAVFAAYVQLTKKENADTGAAESPNAGTGGSAFSIDKAAREAGDFAAKVLKAAKKLPDALK